MPKKRAPAFMHTKPSNVHPSLQSQRVSSSSPGHQTVNERIEQLRREQAPRATPERRAEITELVTQRTIPPALRRILGGMEVDGPPPKPGSRTRNRGPPGVRVPPGPAIPSSWLQVGQHADRMRKSKRTLRVGDRSSFCALAREHDAEHKRLPHNRSLAHHSLRTLALHWEELAEYEQHFLPTLPIHHKEALLSYLTRYGAKGCLDFRSLKTLFQNEKEGASDSEDVRFLDLTGLLNKDFTLSDLSKCLKTIAGGIAELSIGTPKRKEKAAVEVAESWEDEQANDTTRNILPLQISVPMFSNLMKLSLAHPGAQSWASWTDLLALSPKLNTLTHLSLAYWPRPSTTPNAATTSMISKHSEPISLGGSHFYSDLDDDWQEAANILRRFSLNTYCLKWLDLEGCTWHRALTWDFPTSEEEWVRATSSPSPDWSAAWRQIEYLNLYQGWIPADRASLQGAPAGVVPVQLMRWLRENEDKEEIRHKLNWESGILIVNEWMEREKAARSVAYDILLQRRTGKSASWCVVDYGWEGAPTVKKKAAEAGVLAGGGG
ncbi:hypothetical protein K504DRAFT_365659 [Pleomassaria siparia CBS 279.74]|uniref:Tafazzin n=1 Tax=Pleomassaria siparia CBS 279.74 TaxID=1314801 RepID=A0A6G1KNK8_9PLEO|nr:hypothetical protein K504DRAFT_365659 [Pleomassaria siparia CBS 279.74]